ncbi:MAG: hypothetical protein HZA88_09590 [Verrucomicrobia bacterium]|nr:hypothetical protein [Verrucomicrobiota bacterium]
MIERISPDANNYARGGARVFLRRTSDPAGAFHNFGNIVSNGVKLETTTSDHVSGYTGARVVDRTRKDVTKIVYTLEVDENTFENERLWLLGGDATAVTQASATASTKTIAALTGCTSQTEIVKGRYYDLGKFVVSNIAFTSGASGLTAYDAEEGTGDYIVDTATGKIAFVRALTAGEFAGSVTFDCAELSGKTFTKLDDVKLPIVAELFLMAEGGPAAGGFMDKWTVPKAELVPSGDGKISADADRTLTFEIHQTLHPTSAWGSHTRLTLGS